VRRGECAGGGLQGAAKDMGLRLGRVDAGILWRRGGVLRSEAGLAALEQGGRVMGQRVPWRDGCARAVREAFGGS